MLYPLEERAAQIEAAHYKVTKLPLLVVEEQDYKPIAVFTEHNYQDKILDWLEAKIADAKRHPLSHGKSRVSKSAPKSKGSRPN